MNAKICIPKFFSSFPDPVPEGFEAGIRSGQQACEQFVLQASEQRSWLHQS